MGGGGGAHGPVPIHLDAAAGPTATLSQLNCTGEVEMALGSLETVLRLYLGHAEASVEVQPV